MWVPNRRTHGDPLYTVLTHTLTKVHQQTWNTCPFWQTMFLLELEPMHFHAVWGGCSKTWFETQEACGRFVLCPEAGAAGLEPRLTASQQLPQCLGWENVRSIQSMAQGSRAPIQISHKQGTHSGRSNCCGTYCVSK